MTTTPTVRARRVRPPPRWGRWPSWRPSWGPGFLAGLSDEDPAGITTYSVLSAEYGYQLLWVLLLSTVALVVCHNLGARMDVVTG
jgi:Mn2+/Fe2+ NRAMP family transporter